MTRPSSKSEASEPSVRDDDEELVDLTESLTLHSKRTERLRKKQEKKKTATGVRGLLELPFDIVLTIFSLLHPIDICRVSRTSRAYLDFIEAHQRQVANEVIKRRYPCLAKCLRLPVLLDEVNPELHAILQDEGRQQILDIHKKPYLHIPPPDLALICTCLTCILRWNSLCVVLDFAHWQDNLEQGEPIPMIPRGEFPVWNKTLLAKHAAVITQALHNPLLYASILEAHLESTTRAITRHDLNHGNRRRRFRIGTKDLVDETDAYLREFGPPTVDFPFHRDDYYLLEVYLPNRSWNSAEGEWLYAPADQHDRDLEFVVRWAERRHKQKTD